MLQKIVPKILLLVLMIAMVSIIGCGVKLEESQVHAVMEKLYKARKRGSFYKEFKLYSKEDFKIVPFEEVETTLRLVVTGAGDFKKAKHLHTKVSRRNQLGEGLINYLVATYEVVYSNETLIESYFFLASEETPKLVYMTLQFK